MSSPELLALCAAEDVETQKRGLVILFWWMEPHFFSRDAGNKECLVESEEMVQWLPLGSYRAVHLCVNSNLMLNLLLVRIVLRNSTGNIE